MKKVFFILTLALMCVMQADAQNAKVDDKELVGTWIMESMQWKGEKKIVCGKEMGYTQGYVLHLQRRLVQRDGTREDQGCYDNDRQEHL